MFFIKKNNQTYTFGFTIVELLIVISIIGIMSTVVFVNYSNFNRTFALERSMNQTAQGIRKVLEKTMSAEIPKDIASGDFKGGYGVFFEEGKNSFVIFIDKNNNAIYTAADEILEIINLEPGVKIERVSLEGDINCNNNDNFYSVVFLSPDPLIFIGGRLEEKSRCHNIEIVIKHEQLNEERKITVNRGGLIEME